MLFWILCVCLALVVAASMVIAALRARPIPAQGADVPVYRAQLDEVSRDEARGVIASDEASRLRNEIARRLLAAVSTEQDSNSETGPTRAQTIPIVLLASIVVGGAIALYFNLGAPGYGDLPLAERLATAKEFHDNRPSQADAEEQVPPSPTATLAPEYARLMDQLRAAVAKRPNDIQGLRLLARNEAAIGNYTDAVKAQKQLRSVLENRADAQVYADLGEYMVLAAGGYVSPEAETALRTSLTIDPENAPAQYYIGLMMRQTGRPDIAFRLWDRLLRNGPEEAPWIAPIRAQIDTVAAMAGVSYEQPLPVDALSGPTTEDINAASQMSQDDRTVMIRGMVSRLSERLASQGGSAEEWARLITAYGVLGETARAAAIRDEARQVFANAPGDLARIEAAAAEAGLTK